MTRVTNNKKGQIFQIQVKLTEIKVNMVASSSTYFALLSLIILIKLCFTQFFSLLIYLKSLYTSPVGHAAWYDKHQYRKKYFKRETEDR